MAPIPPPHLPGMKILKSDSLTNYKCPVAAVATVVTVTSTRVIRKVTIIDCQIREC